MKIPKIYQNMDYRLTQNGRESKKIKILTLKFMNDPNRNAADPEGVQIETHL